MQADTNMNMITQADLHKMASELDFELPLLAEVGCREILDSDLEGDNAIRDNVIEVTT